MIASASEQPAPLDPLPGREARQTQRQLADPFGQRGGQRKIRGHAEQRPEQDQTALLRAQGSRHHEGRAANAGAEAFQDKRIDHAQGLAEDARRQPDLARADCPTE